MTKHLRGLLVIGAMATAMAGRAAAQTARGTVVQPDSTSPMAGVLVVGVDQGGREVSRALTSRTGEFDLRLPGGGTFTLRVLRIGYRPLVGPSVTVAAGEAKTVRIVYTGVAATLATVNVRDRQTCRVNADTGLAVARVWDEARKAMLMSQTVSSDAPLVAEWIEYERSLDSTSRLVRDQRVRTTRAPTTHAFRSVPIVVLDTGGYVTADNDGTRYFAPDAEVLLSDTFILGHCFRIDDSRRGTGLLGLRFEPAPSRRDKREIQGTMWLDAATSELRQLDFSYTNLVDLAAGIAGGSVEFLRIGEGGWLVKRWSLRMPLVDVRPRTSNDGTARIVMARSNLRLRGVQVAGGEVTDVRRGDSTVYHATGPGVTVQIVSRDSHLSTAGATVRLEGTDYRLVADSLGRASLTPVLAGRYRAFVSTPLMATLGLPASEHEVEARVGARGDTLVLPGTSELLVATCTRDSLANGEGMLHGRVRDAGARPVSGAAVNVWWQDNFQMLQMSDANRLAYDRKALGSLTTDDGYWRVCGVPRERLLTVEVQTDSTGDSQKIRLEPHQGLATVELVLHPLPPTATRQAALVYRAGARTQALLEFTVTGPDGTVLPSTTLEVTPHSGEKRTVTTGAGGRALIAAIAPGDMTIVAKHVGFIPGRVDLRVEEGRNTVPIVLSDRAMPVLDTVRVVGGARVTGFARLDEFEERRRMKLATVSISRADIEKRNPTDISDMLRAVPSVQLSVADKYGGLIPMSTRSIDLTQGSLEPKPCYLTVMVDGVVKNPQGEPFDLRLAPPPAEIHGVEVFAGPSNIPLQYNGVGKDKWCGMIAIWTR